MEILNHLLRNWKSCWSPSLAKKCIICGDFNVDILKQSKERDELLTLLKCYNFRHLINTKTYLCPRNDTLSCLDNFFTNIPREYMSSVHVDFNGLADGHAALMAQTVFAKSEQPSNVVQCLELEIRSYSKKNCHFFRDKIKKTNWESMGVNKFLKEFVAIFRQSFRKYKKKINGNRINKLKWITKGLKISSMMKRVLGHKNHTHSTISKYRDAYLRTYRKTIRYAKRITVQKDIEQAGNDAKSIWQVVNKHTSQINVLNHAGVTD